MLRKALTYGDIPEGARNAEKLSKATEAKLFEVHRGTGVSYKASVRRLVFNLRRNQDLRANVLTGSILPEKFAVMTSQEMASAEMKKIREKFTLEGILEHQKANEVWISVYTNFAIPSKFA
jgi:transcription elongation factor S-II